MPGPKCCVDSCTNNSYKSRSQGLYFAFHRFPKSPGLREEWLKRCGKSASFKTDFAFACSAHFKEQDYNRDLQAELLGYPGKKKLKPEAVPSLNLPFQEFEEENISPEEKEKLEREKRKQLVQECLNGSDQQQTGVLSFELFKKLNYKPGRKGRPRTKGLKTSQSSIDVNYSPTVYVEETNTSHSFIDNSSTHQVIALDSVGEDGTIYIVEDTNNLGEFYSEVQTKSSDLDISADESSIMVETQESCEDNQYLKAKVEKLENKVNEQKKIICSLKRQILREKKMMEKIYLATNFNEQLPPKKKTFTYDERARRALLDIYSLAPDSYEKFARALNFPLKSVISNWDPALHPPSQKMSGYQESDGYDNEVVVEEEYVIEC